uniref:E3 ubiquitin-protein ligase CHFR n=1 Tax=Dunaliella tertiolecta TaxID=3047 RepID=A0A7S3R9B9_DUNTE|mmetsp:Transcript_4084/g.9501  ORF Transcript_4084/g.9501 Transcript_4084/m.9501 type:complete len:380 (+) Transcript_4084:117-1256(+)
MLCSLKSPTSQFDLLGLAVDGVVSAGRETSTAVRLDCPEVPFLLSRRHALFTVQPDGSMAVMDCNSTNGTYCSRANQPLRKLPPCTPWILEDGDVIGFGGPDTIIARRTQVANPFLFKFYSSQEAADAAAEEDSLGAQEDHIMSSAELPVQEEVQPVLREPLAERQESGVLGRKRLGRSLEGGKLRQQQASQLASRNHTSTTANNTLTNSNKGLEGKENASTEVGPASCSGQGRANNTSTGVAELLGNHLACPICHEWLLASHTLSCGHMFCGLCLASWLPQKQSCPTCRKAIAGIPVRCFMVDNAISDLLGVESAASPSSKQERKRKQAHWEGVQGQVTQDWALALKRRQERALETASRHRALLAGTAAPPNAHNSHA